MARPRKQEMTEYRQLKENEINAGLLDGFIRRQVVTKCLRRENGAWIAKMRRLLTTGRKRTANG